eukprot:COSAG01_NODE_7584_length_3138_cov_13.570253_2_plen_101_part_00
MDLISSSTAHVVYCAFKSYVRRYHGECRMHSKARKVGLQRLRPATNHAGDIRNRLRVLHEHSVAQDQVINLGVVAVGLVALRPRPDGLLGCLELGDRPLK